MSNDQIVIELPDCPFCSSEAILHRVPDGWRVTCNQCGCFSNPRNNPTTKAKAIEDWKRRTSQVPSDVWSKPEYAAADAAYQKALKEDANDRMTALACAVDAAIACNKDRENR